MANREVAKLFLLQYYQDLIRQREAHGNGRPMESLYDKILIRYKWLKELKIFCCTSQMQQGTFTFKYLLITMSNHFLTDRKSYCIMFQNVF